MLFESLFGATRRRVLPVLLHVSYIVILVEHRECERILLGLSLDWQSLRNREVLQFIERVWGGGGTIVSVCCRS